MPQNSCCGLSLRQGTVIVALIDIAGAVLGVFLSVLSLIFLLFFEDEIRNFLENDETETLALDVREQFLAILDQMGVLIISATVLILITCLFYLALATYLYKGARERNATNCQLWWKFKVIVFILGVILASGLILISDNPSRLAISSVLVFVYQAFALWVVQAYIDEIQYGKKLSLNGNADEASSELYHE